jgi:hypothetical protein
VPAESIVVLTTASGPATTTTTAPTTTKATTTTTKATTTTTKATTTSSTAAGTCSASYAITSQWDNGSGGSGGGFNATVTVTAGSSPLTSWEVTWTFANGQSLTSSYNAVVTQSGSSVTATNESYNGSLTAGASTTFGFAGTWSGINVIPTPSCS